MHHSMQSDAGLVRERVAWGHRLRACPAGARRETPA